MAGKVDVKSAEVLVNWIKNLYPRVCGTEASEKF